MTYISVTLLFASMYLSLRVVWSFGKRLYPVIGAGDIWFMRVGIVLAFIGASLNLGFALLYRLFFLFGELDLIVLQDSYSSLLDDFTRILLSLSAFCHLHAIWSGSHEIVRWVRELTHMSLCMAFFVMMFVYVIYLN